MKELMINILNFFGLAWWVEITTRTPKCTYYFGPFGSQQEAKAAEAGYVEDLKSEAAEEICVAVKRCKPKILTETDDWGGITSTQTPAFSGQM